MWYAHRLAAGVKPMKASASAVAGGCVLRVRFVVHTLSAGGSLLQEVRRALSLPPILSLDTRQLTFGPTLACEV